MGKNYTRRAEIISKWKEDSAFKEIEPIKQGSLLSKILDLLQRGGYTEDSLKDIKFSSNSTNYGEPVIQVLNGTYPLGKVFISRSGEVEYENWRVFDPKQVQEEK